MNSIEIYTIHKCLSRMEMFEKNPDATKFPGCDLDFCSIASGINWVIIYYIYTSPSTY